MKYIGEKIPKVDGEALVKGAPVYTSDLDTNQNTLTVKLLRSPHAHADIVDIDVSAAVALSGVEIVITHKDVPETKFTLAGQSYPEPSPYDRRLLDSTVRYVGDPVAIIAAVDVRTAEKAMKLISVTYNKKEPVLDLTTAIDHPSRIHGEDAQTSFDIGHNTQRNIAASNATVVGEVDTVIAKSDVQVKRHFSTQAQAHAMMETYRATTSMDVNGRLQVMSSTQVPFHVRRHLSRILDIPKSKIKVLKPRLGGGFGGKQTVSMEMYPAVVTLKTGKAASLVFDRTETFSCSTSRHAMHLDVKLGASADGTIRGVDIFCLSDTGAYGEHAWTVFSVVGLKTLPLYVKADACRYHGHAVYTNKMPGGALRGYGATQGTFALESAVNELAEKLNMDPGDLRIKNLIKAGDLSPVIDGGTPDAPVMLKNSALAKCIEKGKQMIGWDEKYPALKISETKVRGYGMAVTMQGSGIAHIDTATVFLKLNDDGYFTMIHSCSDMGQGSDTVLTQMAAEVLEIGMDQVINTSFDLDVVPYDPGAYASSGTYVSGNAVVKAAEDMKLQMCFAVARLMGKSCDDLEYANGKFTAVDGTSMDLKELGERLASFEGMNQLIAKGTFGGDTSPPPFIAGFAEVEVDLETGMCDVIDFVSVVDCGAVINENLATIQVEGGIVMGIGMALYENVQHSSTGRMISDSFMNYKIPCREDIQNVRVAFECAAEPTGPFGAKSIGEVVVNTPPPAIAHAIYNAIGVRFTELPITPEKVLTALNQK